MSSSELFSSTLFAFPVNWSTFFFFFFFPPSWLSCVGVFVCIFVCKSGAVLAVFISQKAGQGNGRSLNSGTAPSPARSLRLPSSIVWPAAAHSRQPGNPALQQGGSASSQLHGREPEKPKSHGSSEKLSPL